MLRTIDLDNQPRLWAEEIGEEWANGMLTPELESIELAAPQALPQTVLPFGLFTSQSTRGIANQLWLRCHCCLPCGACGAKRNRAARRSLTLTLSPLGARES